LPSVYAEFDFLNVTFAAVWYEGTRKVKKEDEINCILNPPNSKKRFAVFPSPAGTSLTKLSLAWNNLIIPGQGGFGK
jgi:hypothetical protein